MEQNILTRPTSSIRRGVANISILYVTLDGSQIGRMALTGDDRCAFEFNPVFLKEKVSISPFTLPLQYDVIVADHHPFRGGFGIFHDSLPYGWGKQVQDKYLQSIGVNPRNLSVLQRLSFVGNMGRGALEYTPQQKIYPNVELWDLEKTAQETEAFLSGNYPKEVLNNLYNHAKISGGSRPKIYTWRDNKEWMIKFRGPRDPKDVGQLEFDYTTLAWNCGVEIPGIKLFDNKYFGAERFDRSLKGKIHTVSAGGLMNRGIKEGSVDYIDLLNMCNNLTGDINEVYKLFRLMVFNACIGNHNDHIRKFSFQLIDKKWKLSPGYDLLPCRGGSEGHMTTIGGKSIPGKKDIMEVALECNLPTKTANDILEEVYYICKQKNMLGLKI